MTNTLTKPIFFIGVPRSGTTVLFEAFSQHEDLAWITNYTRMFPRYPCINILRQIFDNKYLHMVGKKNQYGKTGIFNRFLPRPDEGYEFWNMYSTDEFSKSYLHKRIASATEVNNLQQATLKLLKWQNKPRFGAKLTGPGRISYLSSVFPDAYFIHIIRDGLSVAHSLLNVNFWKNGGGLSTPWWQPGLNDENHTLWSDTDFNPASLAALQWKQIIEYTIDESKELEQGKYIEVLYEDFIKSPKRVITELLKKVELPISDSTLEHINNIKPRAQMNEKYQKAWNTEQQLEIINVISPLYKTLGYNER